MPRKEQALAIIVMLASVIVAASPTAAAQMSALFSQDLTLRETTTSSGGPKGGGGQEMTAASYFSGNAMKHTSADGQDMIIRFDQRKMIMVDHKKKTFSEMSMDDLQKVLEKATSDAGMKKEEMEAMRQMMTQVRYGPLIAAKMAFVRTWETSVFSLRMLGKMLTGEVSWKNLSGPVTIADYAGQSAQMGPAAYLAFIALISISLGVLNLLPIPLLDGGHLMYYVAEVLKGSPVSERVMEVGQRFGLTVLLFLMGFAFYNDINRLLSG